jgi:hypothetical protein
VSRLSPPIPLRLDDDKAERVRRNHNERIRELQHTPLAEAHVIRNVFLPNAVATPVPHGMGRPVAVWISPPRRKGGSLGTSPRIHRIDGSADSGGADPSQFVTLFAADWGADGVTVDLLVI